jgi:hypothetical protein
MEVSGSLVGVRAGKQESLKFWVKNGSRKSKRMWIRGVRVRNSLRGWLRGRLTHGRGKIVPKWRGDIAERTTSEFEVRTDGRTEKCDKGRWAGWTRWLQSDKCAEIRGMGKLECVVSERNDFIFNTFLNLETVEWFNDRWYVMRLRSTSDSTSKSILDELKAVYLGLVEIVVERVTVVKFGVDYGSGNGGGSFEVNKGTNAA